MTKRDFIWKLAYLAIAGGVFLIDQATKAWAVRRLRFGGDMPGRIETSRKKWAELTEAEQHALQDELRELEQGLAEGLRRGVPRGSRSLDPLLARHRAWVGRMWDRPCPPQAYADLADLYLSHPAFISLY